MSGRLRKEVALERQQLRRLVESNLPLFQKCVGNSPSSTELYALAAVLHSFYNGVENIFKRIAAELDDGLPSGEFWHQELLDAMARTTGRRNSAITPALRLRLKEYLEFRHVFRHAYVFDLRWERMKPLVLACEETLRLLEEQLDGFLQSGSARGQ